MVVVPLVFSALVLGVYELSRGHGLGRIARNTLFFTLLASASSVVIGVTLVNLLQPGVHLSKDIQLPGSDSIASLQKHASEAKPLSQIFIELVPKNPIDSAARALDGEMLALMVFALIFGAAMSFSLKKNGHTGEPALTQVLDQILQTCMEVIHFAMRFAPIAVFALVFNTSMKLGISAFQSLIYYVGVVVVGLVLQQLVVYTTLLKVFTRHRPFHFFHLCRDVYLYAFSTASSNATLPTALETAETKLKIPPQIARFVLTIGSTANQNGTALFEGITVLFLAQVYGVELTLLQQVKVVGMSILAGVGTAGVPGGSLPLIIILLTSLGIPAEGIGLILGVDRFLDMCRTTLNVSGDLVIAALVAESSDQENA